MNILPLFCSLVAIKILKIVLHLKELYTITYENQSKNVIFKFYKIRKLFFPPKVRMKVAYIYIVQLFCSLANIKILTVFAPFKGALRRYLSI